MRELSLFTGAGGGLLGTKLLGFKHVGYVEINDYCQRVIAQRIKDGILDEAPIFSDIRTFISEGYAASYKGMVDVITGGFPCQPFSFSGRKKGEQDSRNMWPETIKVIRIVQPQYALLENVPGLLAHRYIQRIFGDLVESGYDTRWRCLSAAEVGAPHIRDRVWILAISNENRWRFFDGAPANFYNEDEIYKKIQTGQRQWRKIGRHSMERVGWTLEPRICGSHDVDAHSMDRIRAIGNGQVPSVVRAAWQLLASPEGA